MGITGVILLQERGAGVERKEVLARGGGESSHIGEKREKKETSSNSSVCQLKA